MAFDFMAAIANVQDAVQEQNVDTIEAQVEDALDADFRRGTILIFDEVDSIEANMTRDDFDTGVYVDDDFKRSNEARKAVVWRTPKEQREFIPADKIRLSHRAQIERNGLKFEGISIPASEKISRNDAMGVGRGFRVQG